MYRRGDIGQVARALRILDALRGFRRGRTLVDLAAIADASVRTVRRDLAELIDADVKITLCPVDEQPGARLVERSFVNLPITRRERFTLLAVHSVFDVLRGTPLYDDIVSVLAKAEQGGDADENAAHNQLRGRIRYLPDGGTKSYDDKEDVLDTLQTGILSERVVRFTYRGSRSRDRERHLAPLAMLLYRQGLYIAACRLEDPSEGKQLGDWRRTLGIYAVERFVEAEALRKHAFEVPADFDIDEIFHGAFGIHLADPAGARRVVIEFSRDKAALATARVWHRSQQVHRTSDGKVRLEFRCTNLAPVVSWVLEWGPYARVIAPDELVKTVVAELDGARRQYD
jgi:predicted DNA-binding transcriptional regulator YafY